MGKRKRNHHYDKILAKIRKLERKIVDNSESSSSEGSPVRYCYYDAPEPEFEEEGDLQEDVAPLEDVAPQEDEAPLEEVPRLRDEDSPDDAAPPKVVAPTDVVAPQEEILDPEILRMLGEDPSIPKENGENLHKDVAARWSHILCNGLTKEAKLELVSQYMPANNCPNMKAPKLNGEVEAAMTPLNVKKDLFSQSKQNQLSSCLAAVGKVLNMALTSRDNNIKAQEIIKPLSDAGRLLSDCHFRESQSRRYAILNTINKQSRDAIKNTTINENLFGSNLGEHLKTTKAIIRTGLEMKSTVQRPPAKTTAPPRAHTTQRGALNGRGASRAGAFEPRPNPAPRRPPPRDREPDRERRYEPSRRNNPARRGFNRRQ